MTDPHPTRVNRQRRRPAALLGVSAVMAGLVLAVAAIFSLLGARQSPRAAPLPARAIGVASSALPTEPVAFSHTSAGRAAVSGRRAKPHRPARPVRVVIPAIGVRAAIVALGLRRDGTLQTPTDFDRAGWWAGGPRPGERGPAVVVGHVDSTTGPAAFYALRSLRRGDRITIVGADGRSHHFAVQRLASFPKTRFPTTLVYGATRVPRLRLVTCSGTFDRSSGHYRDNIVVFARPAPAR